MYWWGYYNMPRKPCLIPILLASAVFLLTPGCFTIGPKRIKGRNVAVQVTEEKIIIKIQTRYKPERYVGRNVILANTVFPQSIIHLQPANEKNMYEGMMYHSYFGYTIPFFEYYVREGRFVIEIGKEQIPDWFICFNMVAVIAIGVPQIEEYIYETDAVIWLSEEINEVKEE